MGTFVRRTLAGSALANQTELREELVAWLRRARAAGLTPEDVTALVETTMRAALAAEASRDETARAE